MHRPSRITIRSSCRVACCCRIFSKPTSSTVFPLILICSSDNAVPSLLSLEAYFFLRASRKLRGLSLDLVGRMKDAAVGESLRPGSARTWVLKEDRLAFKINHTDRRDESKGKWQKGIGWAFFAHIWSNPSLDDYHYACLYLHHPIPRQSIRPLCLQQAHSSGLCIERHHTIGVDQDKG